MPRAYLTPTGSLTSTPVRTPDTRRLHNPTQRFRNTSAWQRLRAAYRASCYRDGQLPACALCGELIPFHAFTADHIVPVALGGAAMDPGNLQPAHRGCNSARGARGGSSGTVPRTNTTPNSVTATHRAGIRVPSLR